MKTTLRGLLSFLLAVSVVPLVWATTVMKMTNEALVKEADLIVLGRCTEVKSSWVDRTLVTVATISVKEALKGEAGATVTVVMPGGVDANRKFPVAMTFPGAPRIVPDEDVFLFLSDESEVADGYTILGFSQGKFSIVEDADGRRMVSRDLALLRFETATGAASGSLTLVPLEEFKEEILGLLAESNVRPEP